jgi:peptidyl-prolyl cis-trans isomerase D
MFESIRRHRNWLMPLLSVVVFLPFVVSGIYGYTRMRSDENAVAKIDGESISQPELETQHRNRVESLVRQLGGNVDARVFDTPQARASTLDGMLSERAVLIEASRMHLTAPDDLLRARIAAIPDFQVNGKFDYDTYKRLLGLNSFTESSFEERVRADMARQELEEGVKDGAMLPRAVADRLLALDSERRQVRRLAFRPEDYLAKANVSDADIRAQYESSKESYRAPEWVKAEYLVLRLEDLAARATVSEADLRSYYQGNASRWAGADERRASHILITAGKDGSAPDAASAKALAQRLVQQLRANPSDFARVARQQSKDPGSSGSGGDLGWFGRGTMAKPFEDAVFAMGKEGQISDVVETSFGYHIIELTGIRGTQPKPFEEVRASIEAEMRKQSAQKAYAEMADQFTNFVYEQPDGLAAAAEKFKLPLQTVDHLARDAAPPDKAAVFTPAVIDAVFSSDSIDRHHNTKAIDIGHNSLVSVHVVEHTASAVPALEALHGQIQAKLQRAAASKLAREAGQARLAELRKTPDDKGFEPVHDLSRRDMQYLPAAAIQSVMALPADHLPAYTGVDQADGAFAILHVLGVSSVPADEAARAQQRKSLADQVVARGEFDEYEQALRDRFGAKVVRTDLSPPSRGTPRPAAP